MNRSLLIKAAVAVLVLFIASISFYLINSDKQKPAFVHQQQSPNEKVVPGTNKAVLRLANGKLISLNDQQNGEIAREAGAAIDKLANGKLVYRSLNEKPNENTLNTLTTPRGGQFHLVLPDGTEVWLNSASSITYPTAFTSKQREVQLTGEAYFEVRHDASKPFYVNVNGMMVTVLGTHFNINAYQDEASVNTTLLEGSVTVSNNGKPVLLKPGQQARLMQDESIKVHNDVDLDRVIAWKNGYFSFDGAGLKTVLRELSRWYDVEVSYEGRIPERMFGGKIDRNANISDVLKILKETKVNFRMEGRTIVVTP